MTKLNGKMVMTVGLLGLACALGACGDDSMPRTPTKERKVAVETPAIDAAGKGLELTVSLATKPLYFGAKIESKGGLSLPLDLTLDGLEAKVRATTYIAVPHLATSAAGFLAGGKLLAATERGEGLLPCASPAVPGAVTLANAQGAPYSPCVAPVFAPGQVTAAGDESAAALTAAYLTNPAAAVHGIYTEEEAGRVALVICREQATVGDGLGRTHRINNVYAAAKADCRVEHTVEGAWGFSAAAGDLNASAQLLLCQRQSGLGGTDRFHYNKLVLLGAGGALCDGDDDEVTSLGTVVSLDLTARDAARQLGDIKAEIVAAYRNATDEEPTALFLSDWAARLTDEDADDEGAAARQELGSTLTSLRRERLTLGLNAERVRLYGARTNDDLITSNALSAWVESYAASQIALSIAVGAYRDAVLAQPSFADSIQELAKLRLADDSCGIDALALMRAGASRADVVARLRQAPSLTEVGAYILKSLGRSATNDERRDWSAWAACHVAHKDAVAAAINDNSTSSSK